MTEQTLTSHNNRGAVAWTDWLTLEQAGYGVIALAALGIRLWGLGWTPLNPAEASQALPAAAAAAGQAVDLAGASPLLHTLQRAVFMLFGATDAGARWWAAFLGGLSPLLFYALRSRLGRGGALAAASLWAASPLAVWSSRLAVGDALAPVAVLALLAAIIWALDAEKQPAEPGLLTAAVVLGLLLSTGSLAYTALLAGAVAVLWRPAMARRLAAAVRARPRSAAVGLLGALALGSTFFLMTPSGLASVGELLGNWLAGLFPGAGVYTSWELLRRLLLSEPLLLGFGVAGLIWSIRRDRFGQWAGSAAGLALLLPLIGRGREPVDLALVVLWLAILAGPAVARLLAAVWARRGERDAWLLLSISLALLTAAGFCLPSAFSPANTQAWRQIYTGVGIATALIALLVWVAYGAYGNWGLVAAWLPVIPLVLGAVWGAGQMTSLSYDRGAWRQTGLSHETAAAGVADFREALRLLSAQQGGGAREIAVDLAWPTQINDPLLPVVRWQLRDFPYLRVSAAVPADPAPLVVTPVEDQPGLSDRYGGAEFALLQRWQPASLDSPNARLRWVLFREAKTLPETLSVLLWVGRTAK